MKKRFIPFLFFALILTVSAAPSRIVLYVGQQKSVPVSNAAEISIAGRGEIATGTIIGNSILITGRAPGTVSMTIAYRTGQKEEKTVQVLPREQEQMLSEFDKISPLFNDVHILSFGQSVGLMGKIYSETERNYLTAFTDRYPQIIDLTEDVRGKVLLQMDVQILEVNLTGAANLGVEWFSSSTNKVGFPDGLDYGEVKTETGALRLGEEYVPRRVFPDPQVAVGPIARLSPFTIKLNFLVDKGQARVLARPKLVCESGERAEFLVGGEFPVRLATPEKTEVEWKRYGTRMEVEPSLLKVGSSEVEVRVRVEVSDMDWSNQVDGLPAITQRIVSTKVKVAEDNAVAIAGLLSRRKERTQSRLPFLGAIPFLGRLFSSTKEREQEFETVIILTPRILPAKSDSLNIRIQDKELKKGTE